MKRSLGLALCSVLLTFAAVTAQPSAPSTYTMKTYTHKTVGDVQIQADVYRPEDAQPRPVLVWLHGGALMMGSKRWVQPRPRALVAYYGYGDVDGPWYTTPSEFYRQRPLVSKQDAYLGMTPEVVTESAPGPFNRGRLYLYLRQNGLWTKEVTGFDPATEKKLDSCCPVRNITPQYAPIVMLHGTDDTDVPCQESRDMAEQLKKHDVHYEFFEIPGGNHGLNRGDKQTIDKAVARAREFIKGYLSSKNLD